MYRYIYMHMYYTSGDTYGLEVVCIYITIFLCVVSHSVIPDSATPWPAKRLWPWNSPSHNTGMGVCMLSHFSCVWLLTTIWTAASQAPLSMGFSRQEYWSGLPFPYPGHLSNLGIEPGSPALQTDILPSEPLGKPYYVPADSNVYTFQFLLSGIIVSASFWETCLRTQNIRPLNNEKR